MTIPSASSTLTPSAHGNQRNNNHITIDINCFDNDGKLLKIFSNIKHRVDAINDKGWAPSLKKSISGNEIRKLVENENVELEKILSALAWVINSPDISGFFSELNNINKISSSDESNILNKLEELADQKGPEEVLRLSKLLLFSHIERKIKMDKLETPIPKTNDQGKLEDILGTSTVTITNLWKALVDSHTLVSGNFFLMGVPFLFSFVPLGLRIGEYTRIAFNKTIFKEILDIYKEILYFTKTVIDALSKNEERIYYIPDIFEAESPSTNKKEIGTPVRILAKENKSHRRSCTNSLNSSISLKVSSYKES